MRVFVTGASGWIGSAVVPELIGAGHEVTGLARSDTSAAALTAAGAQVVRGDTRRCRHPAGGGRRVGWSDPPRVQARHRVLGRLQEAADSDRRAVETFGEALAGSDRPFVLASGSLGLSAGRAATERDGHDPDSVPAAMGEGPRTRQATAELVLSLASRGVRSSIVRLPPTNHGEGDNGFMAALVGIARQKGVSGYLGDGANRWPAVHRLDSARLFRLALEKAPAGSTLHAVADEGVPIRDIAEVIGRHLDVPVVSVPREKREHFGFLAGFIGARQPGLERADP